MPLEERNDRGIKRLRRIPEDSTNKDDEMIPNHHLQSYEEVRE